MSDVMHNKAKVPPLYTISTYKQTTQSISSSSPAPCGGEASPTFDSGLPAGASWETGAAGSGLLGGGLKAVAFPGAAACSFACVFATWSRYFECQDGLESPD